MSCYVSIYLLNNLFIHPAICFHKFIGAKVSGVNSPDSLEPLPVLFSPKTTHVFGHCNNMFSWFFLGQKTPPKNMVWHFFPYFVCKWRMCGSDVIFACVSDVPAFFRVRIANLWHFFLEAPKDSPGCLNRTLANKCHQSKVNQKVIWSKELENWCLDIL